MDGYAGADRLKARNNVGPRQESSISKDGPDTNISSSAQTFTFRELAIATKNFRDECFLGEGGFGRVYKGRLETGQVVIFPNHSLCLFKSAALIHHFLMWIL